ncbi:MAG TPA: hypothetical protein VEH57_02090 [Thermoplasmata archaeon]|nr:hypothetical protein [Thermoplasmata archaeon]
MASPNRAHLILFVAGEPYTGIGETDDLNLSVAQRAGGLIVGNWLFDSPQAKRLLRAARNGDSTEPPTWHIPRPQNQAAALVLDVAEENGREVTIVDVNRPEGQQSLVDRWVGPDDLLPLLVRTDGARLQGIEEFVPKRVREFVLHDVRGR